MTSRLSTKPQESRPRATGEGAHRTMGQNRVQNHLYKETQLSFDKGSKAIRGTKDSLLSKGCWNNWILTHQKNRQM